MRIRRRFACGARLVAGALAMLAYTARAESAILPPAAGSSTKQADTGPYATGTKAMNEKRWLDAVHAFDAVIAGKGERADGALYWKAYSLDQLGNTSLARATCYQLRSQYRASSWNKDCSALTLQLRLTRDPAGDPTQEFPLMVDVDVPPVPPLPSIPLIRSDQHGSRDPDADLKILAMNSLLNQDPAKAVPMLRGILTGNQPDALKRHALFVLAQSKSPEAQNILTDAARGKMGLELQRQAIQSMALFQGKRANDSLAEVYRATPDAEVKRSVIQAFFLTQDASRMVEIARGEKDLELKRQIVSQLALMHDKAAQDYMLELLR